MGVGERRQEQKVTFQKCFYFLRIRREPAVCRWIGNVGGIRMDIMENMDLRCLVGTILGEIKA